MTMGCVNLTVKAKQGSNCEENHWKKRATDWEEKGKRCLEQERVTGRRHVWKCHCAVNLTKAGVFWEEGTSNEKMLTSYYPVECSTGHFLVNDWRGRAQAIVEGPSPGKMVLASEPAMEGKPVNSLPPGFLPLLLFELWPWLLLRWTGIKVCKQNKPAYPQVTSGHGVYPNNRKVR